jgi:hypothetical protein
LLFASAIQGNTIPDWYKRDIQEHIMTAASVILYEVEGITYEGTDGHTHAYRIDTSTKRALKGSPPEGECYMIYSEERKEPAKRGEVRLVILFRNYTSKCGAIEPGFGAPGTAKYIELFDSILRRGT